MNTKPRTRPTAPAYPTRQQLLSNPDALHENLPPKWQPLVAAGGLSVILLVAGLASSLGGCENHVQTAGVPQPPTVTTEEHAQQLAKAAGPIVAPIFEHGTGRATTGCEVIAPPVFVSEEEARQIIIEELSKVGIKLTQQDVELKDIGIRPKKIDTVTKDGQATTVQVPGDPRPLVADLVDPAKHVAVEYVSETDYHTLGGEMSMSSVETYDFKKVSQELAEQIKAGKGDLRFGVFYDPAGRADLENGDMTEKMKTAEKQAKEDLRQQIRDFAAWLKKQGVI